jgi:broad specificity phosphatase PhoE
MTTFLLIRHGENDYLKKNKLPGQQAGIHLNDHGQKQAADLAESLKDAPIRTIYSSPLERAVETAEPIARTHRLEVQLVPALMDLDVGAWAGRSYKLLNRTKAWKIVQQAPSLYHFPEGESFLQAQERVVSELDAIAKVHPKGLVAVVFHADPIKLAIAHYIGLSFDNFQRLGVGAASVSILAVHEFGAALLAMNLTPPFSLPFKKGSRYPKDAGRHK